MIGKDICDVSRAKCEPLVRDCVNRLPMTWATFQGTIKRRFGDGDLAWLKLSDGPTFVENKLSAALISIMAGLLRLYPRLFHVGVPSESILTGSVETRV